MAAPLRRMSSSRRGTLETAVAWGDTSTWWDWAARCLTLSAAASGLPMADCAVFGGIWRRQTHFLARAHGAAFVAPLSEIHSTSVVVAPRVVGVTNRSFSWACDITRGRDDRLLATTRGTFVHVDATQSRAEPMPAVVLEELAPLVRDEPRPSPPPAVFPPAAAVDWRSRVRRSDADAFKHINNAKWALLAADAAHTARRSPIAAISAIDVDYRSPARPGAELTAAVAEVGGRMRVELAADGAPTTVVDFAVADG